MFAATERITKVGKGSDLRKERRIVLNDDIEKGVSIGARIEIETLRIELHPTIDVDKRHLNTKHRTRPVHEIDTIAKKNLVDVIHRRLSSIERLFQDDGRRLLRVGELDRATDAEHARKVLHGGRRIVLENVSQQERCWEIRKWTEMLWMRKDKSRFSCLELSQDQINGTMNVCFVLIL